MKSADVSWLLISQRITGFRHQFLEFVLRCRVAQCSLAEARDSYTISYCEKSPGGTRGNAESDLQQDLLQ